MSRRRWSMYIPENPAPITTASNSVADLVSDNGALSGTVAIAFASVEDATESNIPFPLSTEHVARHGVEGTFPTWSMISFVVKRAEVCQFVCERLKAVAIGMPPQLESSYGSVGS